MIKNKRQYEVTAAQAERFEQALRRLAETLPSGDMHPLLRKAQIDAASSQLQDLRDEIREYDELRTGKRRPPDIMPFADLPKVLIQTRLARRLTQKDLADRLDLSEQQIQRYEATDFATASFAIITDLIHALKPAG